MGLEFWFLQSGGEHVTLIKSDRDASVLGGHEILLRARSAAISEKYILLGCQNLALYTYLQQSFQKMRW
jgi:hypothetical protein